MPRFVTFTPAGQVIVNAMLIELGLPHCTIGRVCAGKRIGYASLAIIPTDTSGNPLQHATGVPCNQKDHLTFKVYKTMQDANGTAVEMFQSVLEGVDGAPSAASVRDAQGEDRPAIAPTSQQVDDILELAVCAEMNVVDYLMSFMSHDDAELHADQPQLWDEGTRPEAPVPAEVEEEITAGDAEVVEPEANDADVELTEEQLAELES